MANCDDKGKRDLKNCKQFRDDGHSECKGYRDDGYDTCDKWDSKCCDWWPCSWACKIISWFCVAWVWISNLVCVGFYWVANLVCVAWAVVTYMACVVVQTVVAVVGAVITALEGVLGWFLDVLGWFMDLLFSIPIIGRFFKSLWNGILTIFWGIASAADAILYLVGIRPEKTLRVCTILFCDERGNEEGVAKRIDVVNELNKAIKVFRQAHVRIVRSAPFQFRSGFGDEEKADDSWIARYCPQGGNNADLLSVECGLGGGLDDLWTTGAQLQFILGTNCFFGNFRRVWGYGAPVVVFVVKEVNDKDDLGCASPLWDYVTAQVREAAIFDEDKVKRTIAHELGHACSLTHLPLSGNLMNTEDQDNVKDTDLTMWQEVLIRTSRHVTYF